MQRSASILLASVGLASMSGACTGLIAGPEVASSASIPVSRDSDKAPEVCEQERQQVLERVSQTLNPPASP